MKQVLRTALWGMCNLSVECRKASRFFCQGLSRRHYGVCVTFRKGGESPVKLFAEVLADGTIGLLVTLRLSAVRQADFFAKLFWTKKRVLVTFTKVTITNINYPYVFLQKISERNFLFGPSRTPVPTYSFIRNF